MEADWDRRRLACDAFLFGSMVTYFFTGVGMTSLIFDRLDPGHHWLKWAGTYVAVLPFVRAAIEEAVEEFAGQVPDSVRSKIVEAVKQLCDPDPALRGHPISRIGHQNQYSLERYVSLFNLLAKEAEYGFFRK